MDKFLDTNALIVSSFLIVYATNQKMKNTPTNSKLCQFSFSKAKYIPPSKIITRHVTWYISFFYEKTVKKKQKMNLFYIYKSCTWINWAS